MSLQCLVDVFLCQIRFVEKDDIWLSPNYNREGCHLTLMLYNPSNVTMTTYFNTFYQELLKLNFKPRVHFGKFFNVKPQEMMDVFPMFHDFMRLRDKLDPSGLFVNDVMRESFIAA